MRSLAIIATVGIIVGAQSCFGQAMMKNNQWQIAMNVLPKNSPDFDPDEAAPDPRTEMAARTPNVRIAWWASAGPTTSSADDQWITFTLNTRMVNTSYRQIGEVDLYCAMVETRTGKVIYRSKPVAFKTFHNGTVPHTGALEPFGLVEPEVVGKYTVPSDSWRTDTHWEIRLAKVLPVKDERNLHDIGNLIEAITVRHNAEVERLMLKDPSIIKTRDSMGTTPALVAAEIGTPRLERFILAHGGNIRDRNAIGQDAMYYAASYNNVKMLDFGLAHGLTVDPPGCHPLGAAAMLNADQSIKWLLAHGAKVNRANKTGYTSISFSIEYQNVNAFDALLAGKANVHVHGKDGFGLMHMAAEHGQFAEKLLAAGLSVNDRNTVTGETPLMVAVVSQNHGVAKWLLDHGANLKAKDNQGRDVFFYATKSNTLGTDRFFRDYFHNDFSKYGGSKGN